MHLGLPFTGGPAVHPTTSSRALSSAASLPRFWHLNPVSTAACSHWPRSAAEQLRPQQFRNSTACANSSLLAHHESNTDSPVSPAPVASPHPQPAAVAEAAHTGEQADGQRQPEHGSSRELSLEPTSSSSSSPAEPLSKAALRKARRVPPSVIPPPLLPQSEEALKAAFANGALLIDKPKDWTSFDVCNKIRRTIKWLGVTKVGHSGTLDPMATGLLIITTGAGTKFSDDFMGMDKTYSGTIRLGEATPSYDADSEVSETVPWEHVTDDGLQAAAARFVGPLQQIPPMHSAIKVEGQRLYALAREGVTVERQPRSVVIQALRVWREPGDPQTVHFRVTCSKGTYVRSLAHDLAVALGTLGHLTSLRREGIGADDLHSINQAWSLDELVRQLGQRRTEITGEVPSERPRRHTDRGAKPSHANSASRRNKAAEQELQTQPAVSVQQQEQEGKQEQQQVPVVE